MTGASGGVGRAILDTLRGDDVALYLVANNGADALRRNLADSQSPTLRDAKVLRADLSQIGAAQTLADALLQTLREDQKRTNPRVDALVCAAGIDLMTPQSKELTFDARLARAWQIDLASVATLARAFGDVMRAFRQTGDAQEDYDPSMIFFSWDGVEHGMKGDSAQIYAACKGAVAAFARSLAHSLAPDVRVNTIAPGWIQTTWGKIASEDSLTRYAAQSLLQRWGDPMEIARVVRFLLSSDAAYVNAQTIPVNGGFLGREL
jgi:3-oxoacyl-[acyl-carrier protein] reductase